jgi:hypothetical protein
LQSKQAYTQALYCIVFLKRSDTAITTTTGAGVDDQHSSKTFFSLAFAADTTDAADTITDTPTHTWIDLSHPNNSDGIS